MKRKVFRDLLKGRHYVGLVETIAYHEKNLPKDYTKSLTKDHIDGLIRTAKTFNNAVALFKFVELTDEKEDLLKYIAENCAININTSNEEKFIKYMGFNPIEKYLKSLIEYTNPKYFSIFMYYAKIASENKDEVLMKRILEISKSEPSLIAYTLNISEYQKITFDSIYDSILKNMNFEDLKKLLKASTKYNYEVIKLIVDMGNINSLISSFKDNEEVLNVIYDYIINIDFNSKNISINSDLNKEECLYSILLNNPFFKRAEILDYIFLSRNYNHDIGVKTIKILKEPEQIIYGKQVIEQKNIEKILDFSLNTETVITYQAVDYLLELNNGDINNTLLNNLYDRFLRYTIDKIIKLNDIDYLYILLIEYSYNKEQIKLIIDFLNLYNYLDKYSEKDKEVLLDLLKDENKLMLKK